MFISMVGRVGVVGGSMVDSMVSMVDSMVGWGMVDSMVSVTKIDVRVGSMVDRCMVDSMVGWGMVDSMVSITKIDVRVGSSSMDSMVDRCSMVDRVVDSMVDSRVGRGMVDKMGLVDNHRGSNLNLDFARDGFNISNPVKKW